MLLLTEWRGMRFIMSQLNDTPDSLSVEVEVKQLLIQANVHRARGNYEKAMELVKRANEISPHNPQVLELMGDILRARGQPREALEKYRSALAAQPNRPSVEEKIAVVTLELTEMAKREEMRAWLREHPEYRPRGKNPSLAVIASLAIPGAGQVYNEDWVKGLIIFGAWLLCLFSFTSPLYDALQHGVQAGSVEGITEALRSWSTLKLLWVWLTMIACAVIWTYSFIEAGITAYRLKRIAQEEFDDAFRRAREAKAPTNHANAVQSQESSGAPELTQPTESKRADSGELKDKDAQSAQM